MPRWTTPAYFTNLLHGVTAHFTGQVYAGGLRLKSGVVGNLRTLEPMAVLGGWAVDGDGARTNGAGLVGATPTLTEAAAAYAKVANNGVYGNLAAVNAGYTAAYHLFPTVPVAGEDFAYFGSPIPFCEFGIDMGQAATFDAAGVLSWEYWNGSAWTALTLAIDNTNAATKDGTLSFTRDGAIAFHPPADWASRAVDSSTGFWIRVGIANGKAANLTQLPTLNSKEHEIVTPNGGFVVQNPGTITDVRLVDNAGTLHTAADVKFFLMNYTTGACSAVLTFAQDIRSAVFTDVDLAVATGDVLGVVVTQEDGTNEPSGVMLELAITADAS